MLFLSKQGIVPDQTSPLKGATSALGHKTFAVQKGMSALPPKADKARAVGLSFPPGRLKENQDFLKQKTSTAQSL
jgi:hypothetical protein